MNQFDDLFNVGYVIATSSGKKKKWKRIIINGVKTDYKINAFGIIVHKETFQPHNLDDEVFTFTKGGITFEIPVERIVAALFVPFPDEIKMKRLNQENLLVDFDQKSNGSLLDRLIWVDPNDKTRQKNPLPKYDDNNKYVRAARIIADDKGRTTAAKLAEITGLTRDQIKHILNGESHLDVWEKIDALPPKDTGRHNFYKNSYNKYMSENKLSKNQLPKNSDKMIAGICVELEKRETTQRQIAKDFGVSERCVSDIKNGIKGAHISQYFDF